MSSATVAPTRASFTPVPFTGLVARTPVPFPLYLRTADETWVLYRPAGTPLDESHLGRLQAEGVTGLFVRDGDRLAYCQRVEQALDGLLRERSAPVGARAGVLAGVAALVAEELLAGPPTRPAVQRAQKVLLATSGFLLRENQGFTAVRAVLGAAQGLAQHSLRTGLLTMGLARLVLSADGNLLATAGLAGLLHDAGRVGYEAIEHDPEHALRGAALLQALGLPAPVVDAARAHHERWDGSGYPFGTAGLQIPELARVVGMVNAFDKVYAGTGAPRGIYDALRVLAQAYRGCFDERCAAGLVRMFRA
jgi:putative nucleotidyltransferase with HDIG domain